CSRSAADKDASGASVRHLLLAFRAELAVLVPLRPFIAAREFAAHFVECLRVLGDAREIPLRIEVVIRRVVAMRGVVVERRTARGGAAVHHVVAGLGHQRGYTGLGETEMIG